MTVPVAIASLRRMTKLPHSTTDLRPAFLTTAQFARQAHLSATTVKRLCDEGHVAHVVIPGRGDRRIPATEVSRLLADAEANRRTLAASDKAITPDSEQRPGGNRGAEQSSGEAARNAFSG